MDIDKDVDIEVDLGIQLSSNKEIRFELFLNLVFVFFFSNNKAG